jgi:hypothetical protein
LSKAPKLALSIIADPRAVHRHMPYCQTQTMLTP